MKCDVIIAGVGGQGILSIATVLGRAALRKGWHLKQAEVHGMSQRGGAVQSHFRLSDGPVYSDVIPSGAADVVLSMEPMEALRYLSWLAPEGWLVSSDAPVENIAVYPDLEQVLREIRAVPQHILLSGSELAKEAGSARALNMVMLGAASPFLPFEVEVLTDAIREQFAAKGEAVVEKNLKAFELARAVAEEKKGA